MKTVIKRENCRKKYILLLGSKVYHIVREDKWCNTAFLKVGRNIISVEGIQRWELLYGRDQLWTSSEQNTCYPTAHAAPLSPTYLVNYSWYKLFTFNLILSLQMLLRWDFFRIMWVHMWSTERKKINPQNAWQIHHMRILKKISFELTLPQFAFHEISVH